MDDEEKRAERIRELVKRLGALPHPVETKVAAAAYSGQPLAIASACLDWLIWQKNQN